MSVKVRDIGGLLYYTNFCFHPDENILQEPEDIPDKYLDVEVTALRAV